MLLLFGIKILTDINLFFVHVTMLPLWIGALKSKYLQAITENLATQLIINK